jgi:DNA modification methylase
MTVRIITGDCRDVLATLPAESVHCCVTSPPYWGLRDYGVAGTTGLVADRLRRHCIGIELNPAYADMARKRIIGDAPLFVAAE